MVKTNSELGIAIQEHRLNLLYKFMGLSSAEGHTLVDILTTETPEEWIKSRPIRGGRNAKYVEGHHFIERFNDAFGFLWSYEIPKVIREGNEIVAQGRWSLQIPGRTVTKDLPDGTRETVRFDGFSIVKEQFGSAQVKRWARDNPTTSTKKGDVMDLGNDYKAAGTDAMKKCGTELGMFLDVYSSTENDSTGDGPREGQLASLNVRLERCGKDEKWVEEQLGKPLKEATENDVLGLITILIDLEKKQKEEST